MKRLIRLALFVLTIQVANAQTFNPQLAAMLQDTLNTYVGMISNIKGMSASVYIPGQGIWTGVSGNSHAGQPITSDMRFGIASNTKLFVSVMLLKLAENNLISLEDSIKDWLTISNPNINQNITIRQLLNHSSGIADPFFGAPWMDTILANPNRVFIPDEVLEWVGAPLFTAGTSWGYSNTNYVLAGMIAQNVTSYSLATLIRDSILSPLNMDSSFIDVEEPENGVLAHRWWNRVVNPVTSDYHDTSRVGLNSAVGYAGSIFSTSSEMVQWYNALFSGQIINQSSMNELATFLPTSNPNYEYGLGLSREITQGLRYWGHGGRTWGYKSKMMHDTCLHVSVAGLSNSDPSGMDAVTFLLYRVVKNHIPGCSGAIAGTAVVCQGENNVVYTVPPIPNATSYTWTLPSGATGNSNTNTITVDYGLTAVSGNIVVRGVNNYGPGGFSTFPVTVNPVPPTPVVTLNTNVLNSTAPAGNQWYNSSGILVGETSQTYTVTATGDYYSIVTLLGCSSDTSNVIHVVIGGLADNNSSTEIKLYPNPVNSQLTIERNNDGSKLNYEIINTLGQIVLTGSLLEKTIIQTDNLTSGMYLIKLENEELNYFEYRKIRKE